MLVILVLTDRLARHGIAVAAPAFSAGPGPPAAGRGLAFPESRTGRPQRRARIDKDALGGVDSRDSLLGANQIQGFFWGAVLGVMERLVLAAWERMAPLLMGRPDQKGVRPAATIGCSCAVDRAHGLSLA